MILEDFTDSAQGRWEYISDEVMGGVSDGRVEFIEESDVQFVRLRGVVSTENNGGFIQARRKLNNLPSSTVGFRIKARGNGERYFLHLRTSRTFLPWQYYRASFETTEDWRYIDVALEDFKSSGRLLPNRIRPSSITSIAIVAYGRDHEADLSVSRIEVGLDELTDATEPN